MLGPETPFGIGAPVVIKPLTEGSTFGVEICQTEDQVVVSFDRGDRDWTMAYAPLDLLAAQLELDSPARAMRVRGRREGVNPGC